MAGTVVDTAATATPWAANTVAVTRRAPASEPPLADRGGAVAPTDAFMGDPLPVTDRGRAGVRELEQP
ncbi:hypothetical protein GCM10010251_96320 [Streptomyces aurantiogriseus]|uniref:Uncharacterized protein n=1 Tax=Streptomyces aurantiogriseus TaxID=66870 RepID=A0A918FPF5_9ACTN|nr:hypothetical protein GCM10010251_96320 [Streptomyces aurantiogriseus]